MQAACSAPAELAHFDRPLAAHHAAAGERQAAYHRRHRLVIDRRRRREFACRDLSEPACRRAQGALPRPRHHGAQSRRQRRRDRRHDGAVCQRRLRRAPAAGAVAGRHQFRAARPSAQFAFGRAAQRHRGAQGRHRCRRGADRSAICAEGSRKVRDAGHGRADCACRQGRERRSVPALRGDAQLARGPAPRL